MMATPSRRREDTVSNVSMFLKSCKEMALVLKTWSDKMAENLATGNECHLQAVGAQAKELLTALTQTLTESSNLLQCANENFSELVIYHNHFVALSADISKLVNLYKVVQPNPVLVRAVICETKILIELKAEWPPSTDMLQMEVSLVSDVESVIFGPAKFELLFQLELLYRTPEKIIRIELPMRTGPHLVAKIQINGKNIEGSPMAVVDERAEVVAKTPQGLSKWTPVREVIPHLNQYDRMDESDLRCIGTNLEDTSCFNEQARAVVRKFNESRRLQPSNGSLGFQPSNGSLGFQPGNGSPGFQPGNITPGFQPSNGSLGFELGNGLPGFHPGNGSPGFELGNELPGFHPGNGSPGFELGNGLPGFHPGNGSPGFQPTNGSLTLQQVNGSSKKPNLNESGLSAYKNMMDGSTIVNHEDQSLRNDTEIILLNTTGQMVTDPEAGPQGQGSGELNDASIWDPDQSRSRPASSVTWCQDDNDTIDETNFEQRRMKVPPLPTLAEVSRENSSSGSSVQDQSDRNRSNSKEPDCNSGEDCVNAKPPQNFGIRNDLFASQPNVGPLSKDLAGLIDSGIQKLREDSSNDKSESDILGPHIKAAEGNDLSKETFSQTWCHDDSVFMTKDKVSEKPQPPAVCALGEVEPGKVTPKVVRDLKAPGSQSDHLPLNLPSPVPVVVTKPRRPLNFDEPNIANFTPKVSSTTSALQLQSALKQMNSMQQQNTFKQNQEPIPAKEPSPTAAPHEEAKRRASANDSTMPYKHCTQDDLMNGSDPVKLPMLGVGAIRAKANVTNSSLGHNSANDLVHQIDRVLLSPSPGKTDLASGFKLVHQTGLKFILPNEANDDNNALLVPQAICHDPSTNRTYVSDTGLQKIHLFQGFHYKGFWNPDYKFQLPRYIIILPNTFDILVMDQNGLHQFTSQGSVKSNMLKEFSKNLRGLAWCDELGLVLSIETDNEEVRLVFIDLEKEAIVKRRRLEVPSKSKCRFVACSRSKIVITDLGLDCLYITDTANAPIQKVELGVGVCPTGVAVDTFGNFLVATDGGLNLYNQNNEPLAIVPTEHMSPTVTGIEMVGNTLYLMDYETQTVQVFGIC